MSTTAKFVVDGTSRTRDLGSEKRKRVTKHFCCYEDAVDYSVANNGSFRTNEGRLRDKQGYYVVEI